MCNCVQYLCICVEDLCVVEYFCICVQLRICVQFCCVFVCSICVFACICVVYLCAVEEKQKIESVGAVSSLRAPLSSSLPYFLLFFACQSHKQTQANTN